MSLSQKNAVEFLIKEMLQNGEIRPSKSPYSSPAILVRKKRINHGDFVLISEV
jgi:hypothetical protein